MPVTAWGVNSLAQQEIITKTLSSLSNVAAGQIATLDIKDTALYHRVVFEISHGAVPAVMTQAEMKANIEWIKLTLYGPAVNGGNLELVNLRGDDFISTINDTYDVSAVDGELEYIFGVDHLESPEARRQTGLGTLGIDIAQFEIKLKDTLVSPTIKAYAEVEDIAVPPGRMRKLSYQSDSATLEGKMEISDVRVQGPNTMLKALHFSTDVFDHFKIEADDEKIIEAPVTVIKRLNNSKATHTRGRTVVAGYTHIDFAGDSNKRLVPTQGWNNFVIEANVKTGAVLPAPFRIIKEVIIGEPIVYS